MAVAKAASMADWSVAQLAERLAGWLADELAAMLAVARADQKVATWVESWNVCLGAMLAASSVEQSVVW